MNITIEMTEAEREALEAQTHIEMTLKALMFLGLLAAIRGNGKLLGPIVAITLSITQALESDTRHGSGVDFDSLLP